MEESECSLQSQGVGKGETGYNSTGRMKVHCIHSWVSPKADGRVSLCQNKTCLHKEVCEGVKE